MKKILLSLLVTSVMVGSWSLVPHKVSAQLDPAAAPSILTPSPTEPSPLEEVNVTAQKSSGTADGLQEVTISASKMEPGSPSATNASAASTNGGVALPGSGDWELKGFWSRIVQVFAWMFGVAMILLDQIVFFTVSKMGSYIKNLSAIGVAWRIFRDLGNIVLIFGFLAAGLMIILQIDQYGFGRKAIVKMLIVAAFLNFSMFFAEAMIDINNYLSLQVYNQINGGLVAGSKDVSIAAVRNEPLANAIMKNLGLQTLYGASVDSKILAVVDNNPFTVGVMSIVLFVVASFVIFSLAFILLFRFVALVYYIIISPVGFVSLAIPKFQTFGNKWWGNLVEQSITAPVLLLLLYVALRIITDAQFLNGIACPGTTCAPDFLGVFSGTSDGWAATMIAFVIAMGLLLAVTKASKQLSAFGADTAMKWGGKMSFGAATAATGWVGRKTIGAGAFSAAKALRGTKFARIPVVGSTTLRALDATGNSTFDPRGIKMGGGLKALGVDAGSAPKGGYKDVRKKYVEEKVKYASELKGRDFRDLSADEQIRLSRLDKELKTKKDQLKNTNDVAEFDRLTGEIKKAEEAVDKFHIDAGTGRGNKLKYADNVSKWPPFGASKEAGKKIKDEARKSSDDKDLENLKKAIDKVSGGGPATPATPPTPGPTPAGGGAAR